MIERGEESLLAADVDALVNPVNTVGVMGKGLALAFKGTFPECFEEYARACRDGDVRIGQMHVVRRLVSPRFIINFPTKEHWRQPSRLGFIEAGLLDLAARVRELEIASIAIPALGCGLGGLSWADVRPRIVDSFSDLPLVRVVLFEPDAATQPQQDYRE
ncbi:MAG: macro domain-containing protein [Deltaproteobacteria bacterium]|nr:macro domain-containing protein [Deltaproteobacteria bacterium]